MSAWRRVSIRPRAEAGFFLYFSRAGARLGRKRVAGDAVLQGAAEVGCPKCVASSYRCEGSSKESLDRGPDLEAERAGGEAYDGGDVH